MADPSSEEILGSIKAALGLPQDYDSFDIELLLHINSTVATLQQLGVGPSTGLKVEKDTIWLSLLVNNDDHKLEGVKSYIFLKVKLLFDSSSMSAHVLTAFQKLIEEAEWRLTVAADPHLPQVQAESL